MAGIGDVAKRLEEKLGGKATVKVNDKSVPLTDLVKGAFDSVVDLTVKGEVVSLQGFGNMRVMDRKATKARNPQTGAQFDVPASKRMKFTASKTLREVLNGKAPAKT